MKKRLIIIGGIILFISIVNFAAAFYIMKSDNINLGFLKSNQTGEEAVPAFAPISPDTRNAALNDGTVHYSFDDSYKYDEPDALHLQERQLNRYNIARFLRELKYGTDINSYTLSQFLDRIDVPYSDIQIINPAGSINDRMKMLAMSAVYTDYDIDNITHLENYARHLWAYTHYFVVNGNGYAASVLTSNTQLVEGFCNDIAEEYKKTGSVRLHINPILEDYFDVDIPENFVWDSEKRAEASSLMSLSYSELINYLIYKSDETVLYSPLPLYNQGSGTWCDTPFAAGTVRSDGCCPTSIAMVLSYIYDERITPDVVAAAYDYDEYRSYNNGSFGVSMCRGVARDYGLNVIADKGFLSAEDLVYYLGHGYKIVMSVKGFDRSTGTGGDYSGGYHNITLAGLTSDGYVIVNNPGYATDITYDPPSKVAGNQSGKCYAIFSK